MPLTVRDRIVHQLRITPEYRVPILGGALDSVGRSVVQTAHLPTAQAAPTMIDMLAGRWGIDSWRDAPSVIVTKARAARTRGR